MRRAMILALMTAAPLTAAAATWSNAPLVDHNCLERVRKDPDAHTVACLLQCSSSGYGILDEGKWLAFDKAGNEKVTAALKETHMKDHVRVNVTGERDGSTIHVTAVTFAK